MEKTNVTIYDIAKEAGVSVTTVSRVINNNPNVSSATRQKVQKVIDDRNYYANVHAQDLASSNSQGLVGVLVVDSRSWVYSDTIYEIERTLNKFNVNILLVNSGYNNEESLRLMRSYKIKHVILVGSVFDNNLKQSKLLLSYKDMNFIIINSQLQALNVYSVSIDHEKSMTMCYEYMVSKGYHNLAFIQDQNTSTTQLRKKAFRDSNILYGRAPGDWIIDTTRSFDGGYNAVEKLIEKDVAFDGIIFGDDVTALGGLRKLKESGLSVPAKIGVVSWHNSIYAEVADPPLTSVSMKSALLGSLAADIVLRLENGHEVSRKLRIECELVIRKSC